MRQEELDTYLDSFLPKLHTSISKFLMSKDCERRFSLDISIPLTEENENIIYAFFETNFIGIGLKNRRIKRLFKYYKREGIILEPYISFLKSSLGFYIEVEYKAKTFQRKDT
ncbi:TPA: hypothetical protein U1B13_000819 [Streptococcus suis]|nr:hypothetical protein [Streptococcus suis]